MRKATYFFSLPKNRSLPEKELPIEIRPYKSKGHNLEERIFTRNIHETYCSHKGCKFYKKPAVQGVCHTTDTFTGSNDWSYITEGEKHANDHLSFLRKVYKKRGLQKYIEALETEVYVDFLNSICMIDELISLRRENAILKAKNKK